MAIATAIHLRISTSSQASSNALRILIQVRYDIVQPLARTRRSLEIAAMLDVQPDRDSETVKTRIVEAALEELLVHGLDRVSIDAVAARAGTSKSTIYNGFSSKSELIVEVLRHTLAQAGGMTLPDIEGYDSLPALRRVAVWISTTARDSANLGVYRANIVAAARYPELSVELHGLRSRSPALIAFVDTLPSRAVLPDVPAERLAQWLGVLAMGGLHYLLGLPSNPALDHARIEGAVHLFARGWRSPVVETPPVPPPPGPSPRATVGGAGRTSSEQWSALLRATSESLLKDGVRGTSIDQLSAVSGLSRMTIYRRFGDKDGLIAAALETLVDEISADPLPLPDGEISDLLFNFGKAYQRRFGRADHLGLLRLMVSEATYRPDLITRLWNRLHGSAHQAFSELLRARADAGDLSLTDPSIAAEQFLLLSAGGNRLLTDATVLSDDESELYLRQLVSFCIR